MGKEVTEAQADKMILFALACLPVSCVYGPLGTIIQSMLVIYMVWKCDVKLIPAMIIASYSGLNVRMFSSRFVFLKIGITVSTPQMCLFAMFFFVLVSLMRRRYDNPTAGFSVLWLPIFVPALIMSISAIMGGMRGHWTWPIFDALVPAGYLWAIVAGRTWEQGKVYFLKRMLVLFSIVAILRTLRILNVWNFALTPAVICLCFISMRVKLGLGYTMLAGIGSLAGLFNLVFANYMAVEADRGGAGTAELGSTFTNVGVCFFAVGLSWAIANKIIQRSIIRVLPYVMIVITTVILFYAIGVHEKSGLFEQNYATILERLQMKLFNDRGTVWSEGLKEVKTPPYFIKDIRVFIIYDAVIGKDDNGKFIRGYGLKLLPHNQVLTLLGRDGWWLGGVLCIFMWWMHIRTVNKATLFSDDPIFMLYIIPVSMALFHVLGLTGQSTCAANLVNHAFEATIACGIVYGAVSARERERRKYRRIR